MSILSDLEANLTQAISAAHSAQAEVDKARAKLGMKPAPRSFYSRDDVLVEVAAALAAKSKPSKPVYVGSSTRLPLGLQAQPQLQQPVEHLASTVFASLDGTFNLIIEHETAREHHLDMLTITRAMFDPQFREAVRDPALMQQCRATTALWFTALGLEPGPTQMALRLPPTTAPEAPEAPTATAADVVRAGAIRRGEIVELPATPAARAVVAAGRKARNEKEPT